MLIGCSNVYHYSGSNENVWVYWSETTSLFSNNHNNIHVKLEGSNNVAVFEEHDNAIVFRKRSNDINDRNGLCGVIHGVEKISDINDTVTLSIWCQNKPNPFNVGNHNYPRFLTPKTFKVQKTKE